MDVVIEKCPIGNKRLLDTMHFVRRLNRVTGIEVMMNCELQGVVSS